eukprot:GFUD01036962.1.p1 GENE.GFUD01036962.1~~GFUD01036962.1.p1  ORF type:complete len:126 (+),score=15.34 GFUD01036962.1:32-379(+)
MMMILNPLYLLLCSAWFVAISESSVITIDCTGQRGRVKTVETWTCDRNGGSECFNRLEDCSGCGEEGSLSGGTAYYDPNGQDDSTGGWDCRSKCRGRPRSSGSQQKTKTGWCYYG